MKQWVLKKHELVLTILLIIMMCTTRMSVAIGNVVYGLLLLITICTCFIKRKELSISSSIKQYGIAYGIMLLCLLPSVFCSDDVGRAVKYFFNIYVWKSLILLPILLCIKSKSKLYTLLIAFFLFMGINSITAFIQQLLEFRVNDGRSGGLFNGSVMGLAMLLALAFPVSLIAVFDKTFSDKVRKSALFSIISMLFGMWGNQSRGTWLFNGINGLLITLRYGLSNIKYLLIVGCIALGIVGVVSQHDNYVDRFKSTFNTTTDGSNLGRLYVWEADKHMIIDHIVAGVGPGLWQRNYEERYRLPEETQGLGHSHNNFLQVASESGLLGLLGFLVFNIFVLYKSIRMYLKNHNPYDLSIIFGWISFIFLFGNIDYTWGNSSGSKIFWIVMATMLQLKISHEIIDKNKSII